MRISARPSASREQMLGNREDQALGRRQEDAHARDTSFFSCRARPLVLCLRVHAAITTNASVASLPWSYQALKLTSLPWHPSSSSIGEHVSAHSRSSASPTLRCNRLTALNDHGQVRTDFALTPQLVESLIPPHATRRPMPRQKSPSRD
ncbi:hypothetical protein CMEL01_13323 [Colletotrichum melonis]|uniref:Uncharacterized protein n=1 Tax=Colletotrichum melonis TaxID=1209925 RepID=A0AAI9XXM8_9PEZI|nr:hypothetical protein CMEL01_13323 [Colletotrichum melonis]